MCYIYDDGGRAAAGYKGDAGDCGARALAIATGMPYQQAYDAINEIAKMERGGKRKRGRGRSASRFLGFFVRHLTSAIDKVADGCRILGFDLHKLNPHADARCCVNDGALGLHGLVGRKAKANNDIGFGFESVPTQHKNAAFADVLCATDAALATGAAFDLSDEADARIPARNPPDIIGWLARPRSPHLVSLLTPLALILA